MVTPRRFSTEQIVFHYDIYLYHDHNLQESAVRVNMRCSLVLETFNDMLIDLPQDKTFCKSVVKLSTYV